MNGSTSIRSRAALGAMTLASIVALISAPRPTEGQCAPDTLLMTLNNPEPTPGDGFGRSVAVWGHFAVVGAPYDDPGGVSDAGTAYIFDAATGALIATLNSPTPRADDEFGQSVAISGGLALVGAPYDGLTPLDFAGAAYVFDATTGALVATLDSPTEIGGDFGWSVAISGDVAVVGRIWDDPGIVTGAGTAYVFKATTGDLVATLANPEPTGVDLFGRSVAVWGAAAVVGAWRDHPDGVFAAGTAYHFDARTGALNATINNPAPSEFDYFGSSVAVWANVAVVGAEYDDAGADPGGGVNDAGAAYVFDLGTGGLISTLANPAGSFGDRFGASVAVSGNVAIVGADAEDPGDMNEAGAAYVFSVTTGELAATLDNPGASVGDQFGRSVGVSGNIAIVGAWLDDPGGVTDAGTAYTFVCGPTPYSNIRTYLLGLHTDPTGLDLSDDGVVDVADLFLSISR